MQISINISDEDFSNIIQKGMASLDEDTVKNITVEAMKAVLMDRDTMKSILIEPADQWKMSYAPTKYLKEIFKSIDINEELSDVKDLMMKTLKENCTDIMVSMFAKAIAKGFLEMNKDSGDMENLICSTVIHNFRDQIFKP